MNKFATRLALLTVIGALGAGTAAFAAPAPGVDCRDPANAKNPACINVQQGSHHHQTTTKPAPQVTTPTKPAPTKPAPTTKPLPKGTDTYNNQTHNNSMPNNGPKNPTSTFKLGPNGSFSFTQQDRDQFHQRYRGFDFGLFATPNFSITLGHTVPHSYTLRPVPRSIYQYYPQFRGYLYFVARDGSIVIVSPSTYRIVAIL
ncbi:MAG: DUF1236 domain-containing protein [Devosia sp.]|nr:DUF1236 domain-containing protein [Devosia sp.]